jgi:hypothetical protein
MKISYKRNIFIISLILNIFIIYVAYKALEYRNHINHFLDKYTNVVNEFSGRSYFENDNMKLLSEKNSGNRIILFGTQVTENWIVEDSSEMFEFINRGLPHQRLAGFLLRFNPDVIDLKPRGVIIEVSSYNFRTQISIKEIQDYVSSMAELASYHGVEPILTTVIPVRENINVSLDNNEQLENYHIIDSLMRFNQWINEYSIQNNFNVIPFCELLSDENGFLREDLSVDGITPNDYGYQIMSVKTLSILKKELIK